MDTRVLGHSAQGTEEPIQSNSLLKKKGPKENKKMKTGECKKRVAEGEKTATRLMNGG